MHPVERANGGQAVEKTGGMAQRIVARPRRKKSQYLEGGSNGWSHHTDSSTVLVKHQPSAFMWFYLWIIQVRPLGVDCLQASLCSHTCRLAAFTPTHRLSLCPVVVQLLMAFWGTVTRRRLKDAPAGPSAIATASRLAEIELD